MPFLRGNEIIKMIKQVKDIPCIIYTGYDIDEIELKSGADTILHKYVNANYYPELIRTIRDTVENHQKKH